MRKQGWDPHRIKRIRDMPWGQINDEFHSWLLNLCAVLYFTLFPFCFGANCEQTHPRELTLWVMGSWWRTKDGPRQSSIVVAVRDHRGAGGSRRVFPCFNQGEKWPSPARRMMEWPPTAARLLSHWNCLVIASPQSTILGKRQPVLQLLSGWEPRSHENSDLGSGKDEVSFPHFK